MPLNEIKISVKIKYKNMFYTVVGHAALHHATETLAFRQEMFQLVACPTVSPSILDNRFRIP